MEQIHQITNGIIDYNHSNQVIEDNQLLWANGGFRSGYATGTYTKDTNKKKSIH